MDRGEIFGDYKGLRIVSRCASEQEFALVFSHLYESDSLLFFTEERREVGARLRVEVTLRDGRQVLGGRGEVIEATGAGDGPLGKPALRILFVAVDAGDLGTWKRLRRLAERRSGPPGRRRRWHRPGVGRRASARPCGSGPCPPARRRSSRRRSPPSPSA